MRLSIRHWSAPFYCSRAYRKMGQQIAERRDEIYRIRMSELIVNQQFSRSLSGSSQLWLPRRRTCLWRQYSWYISLDMSLLFCMSFILLKMIICSWDMTSFSTYGRISSWKFPGSPSFWRKILLILMIISHVDVNMEVPLEASWLGNLWCVRFLQK